MTGNTNLEGEQINDVKGRLDDIASLFSEPTQVNYTGTHPTIAAGADYQYVINIAKAGKNR